MLNIKQMILNYNGNAHPIKYVVLETRRDEMTKTKLTDLRSWRAIGVLLLLVSAFLMLDVSLDRAAPAVMASYTGEITNSFENEKATGPIDVDIVLTDSAPSFTLTQPAANFISLHFSAFNLPEGDYVTLADSSGAVMYTYYNGDVIFEADGSGWADLVFSDTIILTLHNNSGVSYIEHSEYGVTADQYYYMDGQILESIVGADDKQDAICYQGSDPTEYTNSQAVALLYNFDEGFVCTTWRVGPDGYMLTNEHCLTSAAQMSYTRLYFPWQKTTCGGDTWFADTVIYPANLTYIKDSATYDYALYLVGDTSSIDSYGYLWLDVRVPVSHEQIYLPQHPAGRDKELAIADSENGSGLCWIDYPSYMDTRTGYTCDTEGGSSGSPVIASDSHKVIALHNTTYTSVMNMGHKFVEFFSEIDEYLAPYTVESISSPANGSTIYDTTPEYVFDDPNMADDFRLWISHNQEGVIHNEWVTRSGNCDGTTCTYTTAVDHPYGEYQVMFQARNTAGSSDWSSVFTYTLGATPDVPAIISPSGTENYIRPTYTWTEEDYAEEYRLFVSHASVGTMFNDWVDADGLCAGGSCSYQLDVHLRTGNHSWWVAARNGVGASDWSAPDVFKVWNTTAPTGSVSKIYPGTNETFTFSEFDFTWTENTRASWYKVYMSDSGGKLYNQYHRAADICYGTTCTLDHATYAPLIYAPRGLSELPTNVWINWNVMPVNVAEMATGPGTQNSGCIHKE